MMKSRHAPHCRPPRERRSTKRLLCSDLVRVRWASGHDLPQEEVAILEDYSRGGASFLTGVAVPVGSRVEICSERVQKNGTVCFCLVVPNGYLVGATLVEDDVQDMDYRPEHALDLSRLDFHEWE